MPPMRHEWVKTSDLFTFPEWSKVETRFLRPQKCDRDIRKKWNEVAFSDWMVEN